MADNAPNLGNPDAPNPSVEVSNVSAVLRLRLDPSQVRAELQQFNQDVSADLAAVSQKIAAEFNDIQRQITGTGLQQYKDTLTEIIRLQGQIGDTRGDAQASTASIQAGTVRVRQVRDQNDATLRLLELQEKLAASSSKLGDVRARKLALDQEKFALLGLLNTNSLLNTQADKARLRINAIGGEVDSLISRENLLNISIQRQVRAEEALSRGLRVPSRAAGITSSLPDAVTIQAKAATLALKAINAVIEANSRELNSIIRVAATEARDQMREAEALLTQQEKQQLAQIRLQLFFQQSAEKQRREQEHLREQAERDAIQQAEREQRDADKQARNAIRIAQQVARANTQAQAQAARDNAAAIKRSQNVSGLFDTRDSLGDSADSLRGAQQREKALRLERVALLDLMKAGALNANQTLVVQRRLDALDDTIKGSEKDVRKYTAEVERLSIAERKLSESLNVQSQAGSIRAQANAQAGILTQIHQQQQALQDINKLLGIRAQQETTIQKIMRLTPDLPNVNLTGAPSDRETRQYLERRTQIAQLRKDLADLSRAQATLEANFGQGGASTHDQAQAWAQLTQRAQLLENQIIQLTRQTDKYESQTKRSLSSLIPFYNRLKASADKAGESSVFKGSFRGSFLGNLVADATRGALYQVQNLLSGIVAGSVGFAATLEQNRLALKSFVGDAKQADTLLENLVAFSQSNSFSLEEVVKGSRRLLAMGVAAGEVLDVFRDLGGAVSALGGNAQTLNRVILAYGQIQAKATLQAQDLRQLAEAGIPVFRILQRELGLTADQVFNIGRAQIDSAKGVDALRKGLRELYGGQALIQLDTLQGRFRNLEDILQILGGRIAAPVNDQLREFLSTLGDLLRDPGTIAAAEAFGRVLGDLAKTLREEIFSPENKQGFLEFLRLLPTELDKVGVSLRQLQVLTEGGINLNLSGQNIFSGAPLANEIGRVQSEIEKEAQRQASEGAKLSQARINITATVEQIKIDMAKARVLPENADQIDLSGFTTPITEEMEAQLTAGLTTSGAKSAQKFLEFLDQALSQDEGVRAVGHIAQQLRQEFVKELSKLGDSPSVAQVREASDRLAAALVIPGQFGDSDFERSIIRAGQLFLELGAEEDRLTRIQARATNEQDRNQRASNKESDAIDNLTDSVKSLKDAREAESAIAKEAIDAKRDEVTLAEREQRNRDREFDSRIRNEEANITRLKGVMDPIIAAATQAHDQAVAQLETLNARQDKLKAGFDAINATQKRVIEDITSSKSVVEAEFRVKIDEATEAEKRQARIIKDATLDQREKIRLQDEEIDRIDDKYRGELRIKDLAVSDQSRELRAAQSQQNVRDLEFAKQIAAARARGDTEAVKSLREQRDAARTAFDESQEVARAELQVRQDALDATKDQADLETRAAKETKEDIQRNGQRNLDNLTRTGEVLSDNTAKLEGDRTAAIKNFDDKIALANLFLTVLARTQEDVESVNNVQISAAKELEQTTSQALDKQKADYDTIIGQREKIVTGIQNEKTAFDLAQGDKLIQLGDELDLLEDIEKKRQSDFDKHIKPQEDELKRLTSMHTANDKLRKQEEEKTKTLETESKKRIAQLQTEAEQLQAVLDLDKTRTTNQKAVATEGQPLANGTVTRTDIRALVDQALATLPPLERAILSAQFAAAAGALQGPNPNAEPMQRVLEKLIPILEKLSPGLTPQEIGAAFTPGDRGSVIGVNADVQELIALLRLGKVSEAMALLGQPGVVETLRDVVKGKPEFNLLPNDAVRQMLEPLLGQLPADIQASLAKLTGLTATGQNPAVAGFNAATSTLSDSSTLYKEGTQEFRDAVTVFRDAVNGSRTLTTQEMVNILEKAPFARGGGFSFDSESTVTRKDIEQVLKGEGDVFSSLDDFKTNIIKALTEVFKDQAKTADLLAQIKANPEVFKALFDKLFPGGTNKTFQDRDASSLVGGVFGQQSVELPQDAFEKLRNAVNDAFTDIQGDAKAKGKDTSSSYGTGITDNKADVEKAVDNSIVKPTGAALAGLAGAGAVAGKDTVRGIVGADGLGTMTSADNVKTVATLTSDMNSVLYTELTKGGKSAGDGGGKAVIDSLRVQLGLDVAGGGIAKIALDLLGPNGLAVMSGAEGQNAIKALTAALTKAYVTQLRAQLIGETAGQGPIHQIGLDLGIDLINGAIEAVAANATALTAAATSAIAAASRSAKLPVPGMKGATGTGGGDIGNPLAGNLQTTATFGQVYNPFGGKPSVHKGLDIVAAKGQSVFAIAAGTVSYAGGATPAIAERDPHGGFGLFVRIEHTTGGTAWSSIYAHLSKLSVHAGQAVTKGQQIGLAGTTGASTNPHLHLELRNAANQAFDPTSVLPKSGQGGGDLGAPLAGNIPTLGDVTGDTLGSQAPTKAQAARGLILALKDIIESAGGDLNVVIDAVLSDAEDLAGEKLAGFSSFAQSQMKAAFKALRLAILSLGGEGQGESELRKILRQEGLLGGAPLKFTNDPEILKNQRLVELLDESKGAKGGSFADALRVALTSAIGNDELKTTIDQLSDRFPALDEVSRRLLQFIGQEFGGGVTLGQLRKLVADALGLPQDVISPDKLTPTFQTTGRQTDPAAEIAAQAIRDFALANKDITDASGNKIPDNAITSLLKAIKDSQATTLEEFLASPTVANIGSDDSPLGQLVKILRDQQAKNPNLSFADLQGFLFGGEGFQTTDIVDATLDVRSAIDTTNAILLGATDAESIQIWRDLLHVWTESIPDLVDNTAATAQAAQDTATAAGETAVNTGETAGATGEVASNTATPVPVAIPKIPFVIPPDALKQTQGLEHTFDRLFGAIGKGGTPGFEDLIGRGMGFVVGAGGVLVGIPERDMPDFKGSFSGGLPKNVGVPVDPALGFDVAFGKVDRSMTEWQALFESNLDPETKRVSLAILNNEKLRDEIDLRSKLNAILAGSPLPTEPPPPSSSHSGGGGAKVEGTGNGTTIFQAFNTTVNEANDAQFTAETVNTKLGWEARKLGDLGGRV